MCQTAAGFIGARGIDRLVAFLDIGDLAVFVYHERGAVGEAQLRDQHTILLGNGTHVVAEHRIRGAQFFLPVSQRGAEIRAYCQYLRVICIKL